MHELGGVTNIGRMRQQIEEPVKWRVAPSRQQQRNKSCAGPEPYQLSLRKAEGRILFSKRLNNGPERHNYNEHSCVFAAAVKSPGLGGNSGRHALFSLRMIIGDILVNYWRLA